MRDLTDVIVRFHAAAEVSFDQGGRAGIEKTIAGNDVNLVQSCPLLDAQQVRRVHATSMAKLSEIGGLLDTRREGGRVRRCHGDLHLRNVCLFEGRPTLFDCIEFSDALSCIDVLYDVSFLLMDLVHRDLSDLANIVFNRYLDLTADLDVLPALRLFMSVRAAVRAHVLASQNQYNPSMQAAKDARSYLSLADALLDSHPPCLVAIGGLSGVGKSTVAQVLAPDFRPAPGARVIRSDVLRKRLFDLAPETRLPPSAYATATTERVYGSMHDQAKASLAAGYTVIVDATFLRTEERERIAVCAELGGVPFIGLWLQAPREVLAARIGARSHDASDADTVVLQQQLKADMGAIGWHRIDATRDIAESVAISRTMIGSLTGGIRPASA
jgi:predicted kinase